jgi:hypothetical protein
VFVREDEHLIGVDPHKRSHTAVVLDDCEEIAAQIRVAASANQVSELRAWAPAIVRVWAVENANGLGQPLAQQLVAAGETVIDVPATFGVAGSEAIGQVGPARPMSSTPARGLRSRR